MTPTHPRPSQRWTKPQDEVRTGQHGQPSEQARESGALSDHRKDAAEQHPHSQLCLHAGHAE